MAFLPTSITSNAKAILIGIAILAAAGLYFYIDHLKDELALSRSENISLTLQLSSAKSALTEADERTRELKKAADEWEVKAKQAMQEAKEKAKQDYDEAQDIMNQPQDKDLTEAQAAEALLNSLIPKGRR